MAITKQDVWRIATEIDKEGDKPTAIEIRKRLGSGSYTTITAALKEWTRPDDETDAELEPMPDEFAEKITQAGADLFAIAMRIAAEQFQAEREEWEAEKQDLRSEINSAIMLADQITADLDKANAEITRLQHSNTALAEERSKAFALADERARNAQEAHRTAAEAQQQAERLNGQIEHLRNTCDTAIRENDDLTAELARVTELANERQGTIKQMVRRSTEMEAERDQARKDAAQAREEASRLAGRIEALETITSLKAPSPTTEKPKKAKTPRAAGDKSRPGQTQTATNAAAGA